MNDEHVFLDTNIIVRYFMQDVPEQSARASALLQRVEDGSVRLVITETVIFETIFVLHKQYMVPRADIARLLSNLLAIPAIRLSTRADVLHALDLWIERPGLSYADCLFIFTARRMAGGRIYSFDRKIGAVEGVLRLEP